MTRQRWLIVLLTLTGNALAQSGNVVTDKFGAIIRGDTLRKEIALVFTGDEFAEGGEHILSTLHKHKVKGSFFLTGNFYAHVTFQSLITKLKAKGHYLGAHSDKHLLYADWTKRDSLLIDQNTFTTDILNNYKKMADVGIRQSDAPYFIPPYEWYNKEIVNWSRQLNLQLINFTPGTRSTADYTHPEMGRSYVDSETIYNSILAYELKDRNGLNGFILLIHIGTDPRRTDKFYHKLDSLLTQLKAKGYEFVRIDEMLGKS
ncbi:MAG: polysaccharide deacetylase family protein [Bacteroidetes bacterium CHB5]|nr:polysaccharide deacetylase family protein [Bacteroidetes bacterium CHB5]